ncbi:ester cyclase [Sandaracinobacteroides saxicola]|uniref:Ester cyclase n=1 Tax=Sandaracinobacteroides saxicola TaxID=2759707 RepID=A0A7G5IEX4_9SPHN|nr:ester cyclase [Sandaracinobacteroides saxicola]QMW21916.1 ester cyclase [Sandaracinobacteroides saxicola]
MIVPGTFGRDIADVLADAGPRRQPLARFDDAYLDIVDYILRCTHRIWEQKGIGLIDSHYAEDCPIWTLAGPARGVAGVVDGTLRTLGAFPDRRLIGDAVIWSGDDAAGYLSSHRITSTATHLGGGEFGPPTGRPIQFLTVADCLCRENRIVEEWLVRDNSHIALQLGLNPRALAAAPPSAETVDWWTSERARVLAAPMEAMPDEAPPPEPEAMARWFVARVLNGRRLDGVRDLYATHARLHAPAGRRLFGHGEISGWWAALLGSFGGARVAIDHLAAVPVSDDDADGVAVALRWSLAGVHDGGALYGPATGRPALILGVTHWRLVAGRVAREWTVFDEIALLRQLVAT